MRHRVGAVSASDIVPLLALFEELFGGRLRQTGSPLSRSVPVLPSGVGVVIALSHKCPARDKGASMTPNQPNY